MDVLLIHPPAAKPAEAPLGVAVLLAHLRGQGVATEAVDANLEAYLHLLDPERLRTAAGDQPSTALRRALRHAAKSLELLRSAEGARSSARYATAVEHLNRALGLWRGEGGAERLTLGDYQHGGCSEFDPVALERLARGGLATIFDDYFRQRLLPRVAQLGPRLVGLSVNYRHQVVPAFALAGLLRREFPALEVIGGGGMFSSWKGPLLERGHGFSCFSRIVFGPGELSLERLARGAGGGSYFLEDGARVGLLPDYGFAPLGDYLSPRATLQLSASRGCYWRRCQFCPEASAPTHPYSSAPAEAFPDLLLELAARYRVRHFHLTDNAVPLGVLRALARRAGDLGGLNWHGFVRFEPALLEQPLVDGLAAAGCRLLQLGLESGSQAVLDRLGKGIRLEAAARILGNLRRAGIASYVYIMLGTPGESEADAEQTLRFLEAHAGEIDFLNLAIMNLPRESGLLAEPQAAGIRHSAGLGAAGDLGLYRSFEPSGGWGRAEARRFLKQRLLGSPAIREIVNRTPPLFTSNHAWFFPPDEK
ncbi:radical SAM protein [Desulfuromonas versatilis]|uniref:Radical SAM protein n=1 Tax=Desulfuromonas versatilis TaxID=2802975 RepID=A0ABM8HZA2_9BACT|nr:B12-binding domain-containing radical SAM protein [Desulfuromonas versatilis]BCR06051.1 radical SAM protein [Desulfuromonas versatilis]